MLKKLKSCLLKRQPKIGLYYVKLLHDNTPSHKAAIVTKFLEDDKVTVLSHPPSLQTWPDVTIPYYPG